MSVLQMDRCDFSQSVFGVYFNNKGSMVLYQICVLYCHF